LAVALEETMSGEGMSVGAGAVTGSATGSGKDVASGPVGVDGGDGTSGGPGAVVSDEDPAADGSMLLDAGAPLPVSAAGRAVEAEVIAARAVWSQAPTLIPLLAALSYGLGRLMVDGFYAQLHTTAEAAGLGYGSILEPAAILTAVLAAIGTAIAMVSDALLVAGGWLLKRRRIFEFSLLLVGGVGGGFALVFVQIVRVDEIIALVSGVSLPAFRTLLDKFGSVRDRRVGKARASAETSLSGSASIDRDGVKRVVSVVLSLGFLISLLFGAHELGVYEGRQAAGGRPVNMSFLGFNVPSVTATAVRVQPIASSPAFAQLDTGRCWLEIGSGGPSVLLYDPAGKSTLAVPSDQIVVTIADPSCAIDVKAR
jgi:hypothetical protein